MEYLEFHISKDNLERIIFISIILILLVIFIFALKRVPGCPEAVCEEKAVEKIEVVEGPEPELVEEQGEESAVYYVDIENYNFAPKELTIKKGSTIVFRNNEKALAHKIYEVKGLFLGPRMSPSDSFNYTFNKIGSYTIFSIMGKDKGTRIEVEVI